MMKHPIIRGLETLKLRGDPDVTWLPRWKWKACNRRQLDAWWRQLCVRIPDADRTAVGRFEGEA